MKTILVVEDCPDSFLLVKECLPKHVFIVWAKYFKSASDLVKAVKFDLIILDGALPDGSGFDLLKDVPNTPVVMLTAMDEIEKKEFAFEMGVIDYITKPYDYRELTAKLSSLIKKMPTEELKVLDIDQIIECSRKPEVTRLERIIKFFGWIEGSLNEVNECLCDHYNKQVNLDELTDDQFEILLRQRFDKNYWKKQKYLSIIKKVGG